MFDGAQKIQDELNSLYLAAQILLGAIVVWGIVVILMIATNVIFS